MKIKVVHSFSWNVPKPPEAYLKHHVLNLIAQEIGKSDAVEGTSWEHGDTQTSEMTVCVFKPSDIEHIIMALKYAKQQAIKDFNLNPENKTSLFLASELQNAIDKLKE